MRPRCCAVHLNASAEGPSLVLNEDSPDAPKYGRLWRDVAALQSRGVRVSAFVGGAELPGVEDRRRHGHSGRNVQGFVQPQQLAQVIGRLKQKYSSFGGVFGFEYDDPRIGPRSFRQVAAAVADR